MVSTPTTHKPPPRQSTGGPLRIAVRRTPAELHYLADIDTGWIVTSAQRIVCTKSTSFPLEQRKDWQSDLVIHLWSVSDKYRADYANTAQYNSPQSAWRAWAYTVMQSKLCNLLESALAEARNLPRATQEPELSTLPDLLERVGIERITDALAIVARQEVATLLARDTHVVEALAQAGGQSGALAELERELRITRHTLRLSLDRIRRAMLSVGMVPDAAEAG